MCPVRGVAAQVGCVVTATACSPCMSLGVAQEPDRAAIVWWRGTASGPCILHCIKAMKQPQKAVRLRSNISCPFSSSSRACPVIALRRSPAFQQQQELDGHRRFQHVASELRCVCSIVGPLAHHENLLERSS